MVGGRSARHANSARSIRPPARCIAGRMSCPSLNDNHVELARVSCRYHWCSDERTDAAGDPADSGPTGSDRRHDRRSRAPTRPAAGDSCRPRRTAGRRRQPFTQSDIGSVRFRVRCVVGGQSVHVGRRHTGRTRGVVASEHGDVRRRQCGTAGHDRRGPARGRDTGGRGICRNRRGRITGRRGICRNTRGRGTCRRGICRNPRRRNSCGRGTCRNRRGRDTDRRGTSRP